MDLKPGLKYTGAFILLFLIVSSIIFHYNNPSIITWDVYGYYLYLPAIFQFHDTTQFLFASDHLADYQVSTSLYQLAEYNGAKAPIYTIGMAIVYLPFYAIAHICALILPGIKADGLSSPYQWSIIVASWMYAGLGIYYARKLLHLLKLENWIISLTLIGVFLGTNYFHYAAFENGMPHSYLMTLYILLCYLTLKWHTKPSLLSALSIGLILGIMFLIRPSELLAVIIPLGYGMYNGLSVLVKFNKVKTYLSHFMFALVAGFLMVSIQMIYWQINLGVWIFNGYAGHHFDFLSPHILEGLFSYRKGWFVYTPLAILAIMGIVSVWKKDKRWFWPIVLYTAFNIYWVLSWHIWWYASSFGMRALIQSFGVLIIPFALLIEEIDKIGRNYKRTMIILVLLLAGLNQFQDWQYRHKILLKDEMTSQYYWQVFGKTKYDMNDRIYLDLDELFTEEVANSKELYKYIPENGIDTILPGNYGPTYVHRMKDNALQNGDWVKAKIQVKQSSERFGKWDQARLVQTMKKDGEVVKWRGLRFQYLINQQSLDIVEMEYRIPEASGSNDIYESTIWNAGPDTIYLSSFAIEIILNN